MADETSAGVTNAVPTSATSPSAGATILVKPNGPYIVTGGFTVVDAQGNKIQTKEKVSLCRCGASINKPFCDGTHKNLSFDATAVAAVVPGSKE